MVRARKRACLEPWVVGLITFISLIVLAVCIGLIVHYARYSKYGLPWHHVIYLKYFLIYISVLICLRLIHSLPYFVRMDSSKGSLPALLLI